jgi:hypothetical protein
LQDKKVQGNVEIDIGDIYPDTLILCVNIIPQQPECSILHGRAALLGSLPVSEAQ